MTLPGRPLLWLILTGLSLFLPSCIDLTIHGIIEADGKVTLKIHIRAVDQVLENAIQEGVEGRDSYPLFQKRKLAARIDRLNGFLSQYDNRLQDGIRTLDMEVHLPHPEDINKANLLDIMKVNYQDDGTWLWTFGDYPLGPALKDMDETSLLQQIELLSPILKGLKLDLQIQAPTIVETNLVKTDPGTASYQVDFDSQIKNQQDKARLIYYEYLLKPKYIKIGGVPGPQPQEQAKP